MVETRNVDFSIIFSQLVSKWQDVTPKNGGCKAEEAQRIFSLVLWHLYRYFSLVVKCITSFCSRASDVNTLHHRLFWIHNGEEFCTILLYP